MENPSEPRIPPQPESPPAEPESQTDNPPAEPKRELEPEPEPESQPQPENPPEPTQIPVYPQSGELKFLFRKTLTRRDLTEGLSLVGNTSRCYEELPPLLRFKMMNNELPIPLFTPNVRYDDLVRITAVNLRPSVRLKLTLRGWNEIANRNEFREGDKIDCWWTFTSGSGTDQGNISLLMQKVIRED